MDKPKILNQDNYDRIGDEGQGHAMADAIDKLLEAVQQNRIQLTGNTVLAENLLHDLAWSTGYWRTKGGTEELWIAE